jgi:hypothetical protein
LSDPKPKPEKRKLANVGGTSGGGAEFLIGLVLLGVGAWLFIGRIAVRSSGSRHAGTISPFAWAMLPMFIGVALLFFDARSKLGWLAIAGGFGWMMFGVFARANFYFRSTSLTTTLAMLVCVAGGLGLVFRALRSH